MTIAPADEAMVDEWRRVFGDRLVHPRIVIEHAIEGNARLFFSIVDAIGADPCHLHPDALGAWLARNENRVIRDHRFSRLGRSWRLLRTTIPVPVGEAAS